LKFPDSKILIFCKAPIPGLVKTRLYSVLSHQQAAELHIKLATESINQAIESQLCPVELWCSPDIRHPFFKRFRICLQEQQGDNLGERMSQAFLLTLDQSSSAILMGTDCPSLTADDLEQALTRLQEGNDVVIAPAEDGGYPLIGLKKMTNNSQYRSIFDGIDWGTSTVFDQTISRIDELELCYFQLAMQWDLDRPDDLQRYLDN